MKILILILIVIILLLAYVIWNLLTKNEKQEDILISYWDYLTKISDLINFSNNKIKEIDQKGSFQSDDEIGFFFNNIKEIQTLLNEFIVNERKEVLDRRNRKGNN